MIKNYKIIEPSPKFYQYYMPDQILDIINSLDVRKDAPLKYSYIGNGTKYWDEHQQKLLKESSPNSTANLVSKHLTMSKSYFDYILKDYKSINIVDIGPGNGDPVKDFISYAKQLNKLDRYISIDISPEMLVLAEKNLKQKFGQDLKTSPEIKDICFERFNDILVNDPAYDYNSTTNLLLMLGGTLGNFDFPEEVLRTVYYSMSKNDIFVYSLKLATEQNKNIFDFEKTKSMITTHRFLVVEMLNLDEDLYDIEMGYDDIKNQRYVRIKLKTSITLRFKVHDKIKDVDFKKDDTIDVWHYKHQSAQEVIDLFSKCGFNVLQANTTPDHEFMLLICDIQNTKNG